MTGPGGMPEDWSIIGYGLAIDRPGYPRPGYPHPASFHPANGGTCSCQLVAFW